MGSITITSSVCRSVLIRPRSWTWHGWTFALLRDNKPNASVWSMPLRTQCVMGRGAGGVWTIRRIWMNVLVQLPNTSNTGKYNQTWWNPVGWDCGQGQKQAWWFSLLFLSLTHLSGSHTFIRNTDSWALTIRQRGDSLGRWRGWLLSFHGAHILKNGPWLIMKPSTELKFNQVEQCISMPSRSF